MNNEHMFTPTGQIDDSRYTLEVARGGQGLIALDGLLDVLIAARFADLFTIGIMPLKPTDHVALLARGSDVWLMAAGAVFGFDSNGSIVVTGACDELPSGWSDASRTVVHLFDGRSLFPPEPPQAPSSAPNQGKIFIALMECAPRGGQIGRFELTLLAGLPEDGSHDEASFTQRRVQAAGRGGVHCRGDAARALAAA